MHAHTSDSGSDELGRVVILREGIKAVAVRAFQVNVLGLNAILLAKQFGERARGFGVISNELRDFSKQLRDQMGGLTVTSCLLVGLATRQLKLRRHRALLQQAAQNSLPHLMLVFADKQLADQTRELEYEIAGAHNKMTEYVEAAYQSCLFGTVIARSAKIEAAHSGSGNPALAVASEEFSQHVDYILPSLQALRRALETAV
ncbi:hypothetical protein [Chitinimonas sp.]|uniref:hypothetical protein n=1 Tax=Chitinimonas sp. TaxID=1934313 RepID=UPI0035AF34FD